MSGILLAGRSCCYLVDYGKLVRITKLGMKGHLEILNLPASAKIHSEIG